MMDCVRYYPLIRTERNGVDFTAMTPTDSEKTIRENHVLWLSEFVPNYYRLGAADKPSVAAVDSLRLHCPKCGAVLKPISAVILEHSYPLYACDNCTGRR